MSHRYLPHTAEEIGGMLEVCGARTLDDLFADVPSGLRLTRPYRLPAEMSEKEVRDFFKNISRNITPMTCFAGDGVYHHWSPAAVASLISRSEFLTAYTPYQPEISQGTLQYIFEFQTMMARLTGMEVSNASMYDGATATAEAMMMATAASRKRSRVLISATVSDKVRHVAATYARYHGITLDVIPEDNGVTSADALSEMLSANDVAGVVLPSPNRYGIIEDFTGLADTIHSAKALFIINCVVADLATIRTPGEWGADIAAGDAQSLGIPMNYGGPGLGFITTRKQYQRKLPGRIVGATTDKDGQRTFVLTLQAREQHIRREKATSNICSNQSLMALYVTIYMSLLGTEGLHEVNRQGANGAHYLAAELCKTGRVRLAYPERPFLNEFALRTSVPVDTILSRLADKGILGGVKLADDLMTVAVTEMQTCHDIETYINTIKDL